MRLLTFLRSTDGLNPTVDSCVFIAAESIIYSVCRADTIYYRLSDTQPWTDQRRVKYGSRYEPNVAQTFSATIHRHPIIHRYDLRFHVYIRVMCCDVSAENNQVALIINQPIWNSHFWRLTFIFVAAIFRQDVNQRYLLCGLWTRPPVSKSSYHRYRSNEKL